MNHPGSIDKDDLSLAMELAVIARDVALPLFRKGLNPVQKSDGSPVTAADIEIERRLFST